jgi:hypothetical protein
MSQPNSMELLIECWSHLFCLVNWLLITLEWEKLTFKVYGLFPHKSTTQKVLMLIAVFINQDCYTPIKGI